MTFELTQLFQRTKFVTNKTRYYFVCVEIQAKSAQPFLLSPIDRNAQAKQIATDIGVVVRSMRLARNLSQEALAEITGHHRNYIGFLERGEVTPNVHTLARIARAFNKPPSSLLQEAGW